MHEGWFCEDTTHGPVCVDRFDESRPHAGKVLGIVQAHADDMPLCSGGLVAKLVAEGYTAFLIQTTNDEKCGAGTIGDAIKSNEVDVEVLANSLGLEDVFNLGYRNHRQDENSMLEQRCRLIFLFRHLKVDTVMSFHPWAKWGGESRPLYHRPSGGGGLLDGGFGQGLSRAGAGGDRALRGEGQILLGYAAGFALQPCDRYWPFS